ncbi:MAG: hypothetical protein Q8P24_04850 [Desulfobacterales bacterium]|nr:hypothetical protein [Desulfobacterales bacterium]
MKANLRRDFKELPKSDRSPVEGFTLLDMLLVIMILGIVGMAVIPQFGEMANDSKLKGAALELVSALDYAKNLAITHQRPFSVQVFTKASKNQFAVIDHTSGLDDNVHPEATPPLYTFRRVYNPSDKIPYIIDFDTPTDGATARPEYEGVSIVSVPGGGANHTIVFYPDGHSSNTDSSYALSLGNLTRTIIVQGTTGRILAP